MIRHTARNLLFPYLSQFPIYIFLTNPPLARFFELHDLKSPGLWLSFLRLAGNEALDDAAAAGGFDRKNTCVGSRVVVVGYA